ncbi:hypothetical protein BDB01DRAFT_839035 [Pilobolus umbonatus]|nr:hypothetical protein BDB01DRAFT_839035 [Pilobolus umbonatus]
MSPDTKLIASLVNRIHVRLPSNSGKKLEALENDPLVNQTVSALIELSKFRLPTITSTLLHLLDSIKSQMPSNDEYFPFENLQSQLFVIRMLSACMQHHWQYMRGLKKDKFRPTHQSDISDHSRWSTEDIQLDMEDPPPFDDTVAKATINSMCRIMHQTTVMEDKEFNQATNHVTQISRLENYTADNIARTSADIVLDIYKASSRVIAYLSASNWTAVFSKIRMRIVYLKITQDENPESSDMRLLECCSLNSQRLSIVLAEFCDNFKDFKKTTQLVAAAILRRAIWGWIETYPGEFMQLCHNQKTLDGGPDVLFDVCNALADNPRKRAILWPLQTMLLILCPDVLSAYSKHEHRSIYAKKTQFLSTLKSTLKQGRVAELAAICYVDVCKAATYVSKSDTSALRHLVPDIESELRGQLFDPERPLITDSVMSGLGIIIDHRGLLADCLVAMFRLNPRHALRSLFPACLDTRAPTLFKISLVKACLSIASEENRLPWNPSVTALYDSLCGPLRKLFIEFTSKDYPKMNISNSVNMPNVNSRKMMLQGTTVDKKSKKSDVRVDQNTERMELILDMLRLYQADPKLAIRGSGEDRIEMNAITMVAITNCLREPNQYVRDAAATCLYQLHSTDYIKEWSPSNNFMESFWIISSQVVFALAKQLLDNRDKEDGTKRLLELLKKLFESRNDFLKKYQDIAMQGSETKERLQASIGVEVALLVLLCSSDIEICTSAIECFGLICTESNITESADDPHQSILMVVENLPIYTELSSNNGLVTGRKSQQKQIRRLLRMMTHFAPGNLAAWEEVYERWRYMTPSVVKPHDESKDDLLENGTIGNTISVNANISTNLNVKRPTAAWHDKFRNTNSSSRQPSAIISYSRTDSNNNEEDKSPEWQNYAGFLAALGGICLMADVAPGVPSSPLTPRVESSLRRSSTSNEYSPMVNRFVIDMVDLLLCDNVIVREWVKEILGSDLSPALYPMLFRYMETVLSKHFESDGDPICNSRNTLFVEQAISVLKLVLDRMESSAENLLTVDFSSLINQYARYLNKLGNDQSALKIKIKFCQLTKVLMTKKDKVTLRQEFKLRNKLLEIIVEWTSDFSLKPDLTSQFSSFEVSQSEKLHRELDLACLGTIVGLLHQLPLQSSDPVHESDSTSLKSKIFYNYFTFFLKLLNRCRDSENESETHQNRSYLDTMTKTKENVNTYLAPLKEKTILAMSNLLSANVDAGLKYCLSMGYHDDPQMRTAFMKVLTNILNQGTEFETLAETVMIDRYEKLVNMLVGMDLQLALSLCDVCPASDVEDAAHALLASFASRGKTLVLLKAVIQKEVQNTDNETELLRRTSIATRLLALYAKQNGADYVRSVLQPVFQQLAEMPAEEKTFELDTTKVISGEDVNRNKKNVERATELFLNAICASAYEAPKAFRELCHCILTSVRERYPEAKYTAVGAFIFLRFFCPAIVSPEAEGLVKPSAVINRDMKRGYLIVTKVIQNLANNVLFGAKEAYMIMLNDFLTSNIYKVTSFLRDISEVTSSAEAPETESLQEITPLEENDYACIHRVLFDNMERLYRELATRKVRQLPDAESSSAWKRQFDRFSNLMAQLGRPPEVTKQEHISLRSYTFAAANQFYAEFMRRNSHRSVESLVSKNIFYEGGVSKNNRPVFYYIARNVLADNVDFELLVYLILQIMERASNKSFEVVMDMTMFSSENELPLQWFTQILQLIPVDSVDNVANIIIYNPNSHLQKYLKKLPRPLTHKISKKLTFAVTLAEIYEFINPNEIRLPKSTTSLDTEQCTVFHPVNRLLPYKITIPITVRVSSEHVQFMTVRKQDFFYGITTIINDVFLITDIDDIVNIPNTRNQEALNEFQFKYNKDKTLHMFSSVKRDMIVNHIRHYKRRLEMTKPNSVAERNIRPNDVPGRLLNMALLNIGSDDPSLRLAAYNLLYALSVTFHFEVGNQLLDARDLCLPANSTAFIVHISEKIAQNQHNLTLEFLRECFTGFQKSSEPLRYLCLDYMMPWLPNLSRYCQNSNVENDRDTIRTKEVLRNLIDLTVARTDMYKLVQAKIWKTIGQIDDVLNMVLDSFVQFSIEHGVGSPQAEAMADTFVTLSNISVRGKVISRLRKVLQKTSFKPTRTLTDHWTWKEIAILIRFILMISFNNRGPIKSYVPELLHIVTIVIGVGPTIIKSSVHGLVINIVQSLCTTMPIPEANVKKLQHILAEMSDTKYRVLFGLTKPYAGPFTIIPETLIDVTEPIPLQSLETIVNDLLEVITYSAPSTDMANAWRARWMSLVASTTFQFNPAIQPQSFVVLGCLGREDVDDDLLYQILVALRGALVIFNEGDCNLVLSIMMCLKNIVGSLPSDSRYLLSLFWVAIALVQMNNSTIFCMAIELVLAVIRALETHEYFAGDRINQVLLIAREPMLETCQQLDALCGVNFTNHFSFAVTCTFLKGLKHANAKGVIFQGLSTFLDIQSKHNEEADQNEYQNLGYLAGLLPIAVKNEALKDVLRMTDLNKTRFEFFEGVDDSEIVNYKAIYDGIFDQLDITDETNALLFISVLVAQLQTAESTNERLFIYGLLAEAANSLPDVFALTYDSLLPKMNHIVLNSNNQLIIESVKSILLTACSDAAFGDTGKKGQSAQKVILERLGFNALGDATFGASTNNTLQHAQLTCDIIDLIIA